MTATLLFWLTLAWAFNPQGPTRQILISQKISSSGSVPTYENSNSASEGIADQNAEMTACTCTGSNKVMIITLHTNIGASATITAASYNGSAITGEIASTFVNFTQTFAWIIVNPVSAATFTATLSQEGTKTVTTACYNGVNQSTPNRTATTASGTSNPATVNVTNAQSGDLIVGAFGLDDTTAANGMTSGRVGAGQTFRITTTNSSNESQGAISDKPGASGSVTISWDFVNNASNGFGVIAIPLIPN